MLTKNLRRILLLNVILNVDDHWMARCASEIYVFTHIANFIGLA